MRRLAREALGDSLIEGIVAVAAVLVFSLLIGVR